jgi:rfaE bifunctional protein nucleotidyltransferase chain/domain
MSQRRIPGILTPADLPAWRDKLRALGKTIVLTNGCFDLLHVGHIRYLQAARAMGDALIVGVNGDESVRALKGKGRPIIPERERAEVLIALASVDAAIIFPETTAHRLLSLVRPDVYVKGGDWKLPGEGGKTWPEAEHAQSVGARLARIPLAEGRSTSDIIAKIKQL